MSLLSSISGYKLYDAGNRGKPHFTERNEKCCAHFFPFWRQLENKRTFRPEVPHAVSTSPAVMMMIGSFATGYSVSISSTMGARCVFILIFLVLGNTVHPTKTTSRIKTVSTFPTTTISDNNTIWLWLEFLPKTTLDIVDCPALIPCLKSFTVKNIHTDVEVFIASVTSNSSNVHVVTFQSSLLLPEDKIMIQILFLPYLEDSVVSARLVLETSLGLVEYVVMGHSIANPYKVS